MVKLKTILKESIAPFTVSRNGIGDFYVQADGQNAGKPFKVKPEKGHYFAVTTDKNILLPDYLYYVVEHLFISGAFRAYQTGIAIPHLPQTTFKDVVMNFFRSQKI